MNRRIIFIPNDGSYIEICGHIINWEYGWEEFLEYLKQCDLAIEKATPKEGVWEYDNFGDGTLCCPNCKKPIVNVWSKTDYKPNYCHYCGQRLEN